MEQHNRTPPQGRIPLCVPELRGQEWEYIKECLDTSWVSSAGKYVDRFEQAFTNYTRTDHAVACVNGTAALHLALRAARVEPDTEVLVSSLTFIAPANAVRYVGAHPIFVDAEPDTWQMDPRLVVEFLHNHCRQSPEGHLINPDTGRRVSAIIPVHILGHPVDLDPIIDAATHFAIPVIEDASESLGASYKGRPVGGIGTMGCFSFNGNKMITTGGGGMLVSSDEALAARARYLSTQAKDDPIEYNHHEVGHNYRLTNIQAAMGCAQLEHLQTYVEKKRIIANRYNAAFAHLERVRSMLQAPWAHHARWLFAITLDRDPPDLRKKLMAALEKAQVETRPLWQPMHLSPAHAGSSCLGGEVAKYLQERTLCLPSSVGLNDIEQDYVIAQILSFLERH